jgi:hypothetical protein
MRYAIASSAVFAAAVVASPVAQGVTDQIKPDSSAPSGCSPNYSGDFEIQVTNVTQSSTKRSISKVRSFNVSPIINISN